MKGKHYNMNGVFITSVLVCILCVMYAAGAGINPMPLLVLAVIFSTYQEDFVQGLVSSLLAIIFSLWWFAEPHTLVSYQPLNLISVILLVIGLPLVSLLTAVVKTSRKQLAKRVEKLSGGLVEKLNSYKTESQGVVETRLQAQINKAIDFARKDKSKVIVISVELATIDQINRLYGADVGLEVIDVSLHRLLNSTRRNDFAERVETNKFVVVLVGIRSEAAIADSARRLVSTLGETMILPHIVDDISVDSNAGIASFPEDCNSAEELLSASQQALDRAKNNNAVNQVVLYGSEISQSSELRLGD